MTFIAEDSDLVEALGLLLLTISYGVTLALIMVNG
jgi:hypothetical protein